MWVNDFVGMWQIFQFGPFAEVLAEWTFDAAIAEWGALGQTEEPAVFILRGALARRSLLRRASEQGKGESNGQ